MAIISRPNTYTAGTVAQSGQVNSDFNTIYADYNGNITAANISASAAILDTQLNQITTAGKVSGTALTGLASIVSGAGIIPSANLPAATPNVGMAIQVVNTETGAVSTGTTQMVDDDTIPQSNEGDQYMSLAITPGATTNKLLIEVVFNGASANSRNVIAALYQDATANSLAAVKDDWTTGARMRTLSFAHFMTAGTTSATTFKVRVGSTAADTVTFNGEASARKLGGVVASTITITEFKA